MLLITYNLNNHDDDYDAVFDTIGALGAAWHDGDILDSVWFLRTTRSIEHVSATLREATDTDDTFLVVDITASGYQGWMPEEFWAWLDA